MISIDTNIVVRLLTRDDEQQYQRSLELLQNNNVFIPDSVILETEWVLRFAYEFERIQTCQALRDLLGLPNVYLAEPDLIAQVLEWHENGLDFADAFHLSQTQNSQILYSFDKKFVKKATELTDRDVREP
ncbi:type II toxin-antitoxin system VapC family toxin [Roseofilum casamattae]|uniref:Type II toxin-antitoxin system VapC family toxin n=1 Tax=Roseofilum casamattae BLCC-M143 TaxID=3022442 RepID=A0ABT7BXS6_9CYAN|nr:type II toxin-antitoxin system VapC family toxin [Roseofilum casamattae]MDJ1183970.1 type II toxin-antitoxin system VapC family toxin [Roseofilum casamattae BLCC-M143]